LIAFTPSPIPGFPDVPTFKDVTGKNYINAGGLMGPARMDPRIVKKLEDALQRGTRDPEYLSTLEKMGAVAQWRGSAEFGKEIEEMKGLWNEFLGDLDLLKKK
jgi:tripartite-type tricarboxylate transporter receptor subunit TctC